MGILSPPAQDFAKKLSRLSSGRESITTRHLEALFLDLTQLSVNAQELVAQHVGWEKTKEVRVKVVSRPEWVDINLETFKEVWSNIIEPALKKNLANQSASEISQAVAFFQLAIMFGWLSRRVLGQYAFSFGASERDSDIYYVGSNIVGLEEKFAFNPREFRLWLALHEVTHYLQFKNVLWLDNYLQSLVKESVMVTLPDLSNAGEVLKNILEQIRSRKLNDLSMGLAGILGTKEQMELLKKVQVLMSLIEGQADLIMNIVGERYIKSAPRFARILKTRRLSAKGLQKLLQQLLGMEAKLKQYADGEKFLKALYLEIGPAAYSMVFHSPETLPTIEELNDPQKWLTRNKVKTA